jgi:hypothetical protein
MEMVDDFDMELLVLAIPSYPPQGQGSYVRHIMFVDIEAPDLCEILSKVVRRVLMGRARGGGLISASYIYIIYSIYICICMFHIYSNFSSRTEMVDHSN